MGLHFEMILRMVSHTDFQTDAIGDTFRVVLERVSVGSLAAAAVAQQKRVPRVGTSGPAMQILPEAGTVAGRPGS
jgi:hypothetical protein